MTLRALVILLFSVCRGFASADDPISSTDSSSSQNVVQNEHAAQVDGLTLPLALGVTHDISKKRLVFSVHYLWDRSVKITSTMKAYIKIDSKKYTINSSDMMICGSHNAGDNVIEEHVIDNYRFLGNDREIPGLRNAKSITFGIEGKINAVPVDLEKRLSVKLFPPVTLAD